MTRGVPRENQICSVENCDKQCHGEGLCTKHYMRIRRRGTLEITTRQAGTGTINDNGYIRFGINHKRI